VGRQNLNLTFKHYFIHMMSTLIFILSALSLSVSASSVTPLGPGSECNACSASTPIIMFIHAAIVGRVNVPMQGTRKAQPLDAEVHVITADGHLHKTYCELRSCIGYHTGRFSQNPFVKVMRRDSSGSAVFPSAITFSRRISWATCTQTFRW
jgi:hypothetical protein